MKPFLLLLLLVVWWHGPLALAQEADVPQEPVIEVVDEPPPVPPYEQAVPPPAPPAEPPVINVPTPVVPASRPPEPVRAPQPALAMCGQPMDKPLDLPMSFQGSPISAVVEFYGRLTCRSVIQAPNVQGQIWFTSTSTLTLAEAIQALDTVLAINGIAVLPVGEKFLKVVQIATAKQEGPPVSHGAEVRLPAADGLVTHIIPLKFIEVGDVVGVLQPYLHAYGQILPLPKSNSILITETAQNINQMLQIIQYMDQPSPLRVETRVYTLRYARAAEVVNRLQQIIQETQQLGAPAATTAPQPAAQPGQPARVPVRRPDTPKDAAPGTDTGSVLEGKVVLTADERTNKIFILSRPSNFEFFDRLIEELDASIEPDLVTRVIPLDYAAAEDTAALLTSLITGGQFTPAPRTRGTTTTTAQPPGARTPPPPAAVPAPTAPTGGSDTAGFFEYPEGVRILPDQRTNSLLVMATRRDMERLEALVRSIDTAVAQVLVEVVIAEVKLDGSLQMGVDLFKRLMKEGQVLSGGGTRNLTDDQAPINLEDVALPAASAFGGGLTYFLTLKNTKLDAVIRLLASSSRFKVLSTPVIQTLHNKEASIIVGESRPVPTSTISDSGGDGIATRANIEFKDIAIELRVTPRINPDGYVTMEIEQKINDFAGNVNVAGVSVPIITKREARAEVAVRDQSTIVLGGLIREDKNLTESRVPFVGDIPVLGHLFKNKSTTKNRTELIVFLRPVVLRNNQEAVTEAERRREMLQAGRELQLRKAFEGNVFAEDEPPLPPPPKKPSAKAPTSDGEDTAAPREPTRNFGPRTN